MVLMRRKLPLFAFFSVNASAFVPINSHRSVVPQRLSSLNAATLQPPPITTKDFAGKIAERNSWERDAEKESGGIKQTRTTLDVRMHGVWYDLSGEFNLLVSATFLTTLEQPVNLFCLQVQLCFPLLWHCIKTI